jgi:hypothetical protein
MMAFLQDIGVVAGLFALVLLALETGFRAGRRVKADADPKAGAQIGAIQGAMLGLLGLLLGFSFAAAGSRFLERQDLIVAEANAIGTSYLRADLLDQPARSELRAALQEYTSYRLQLSTRLRSGLGPETAAAFERQHASIWLAARTGVAARPEFAEVVLPPINEVIDLHAVRMAAGKKHLPPPVMGLLIACSVLAIAVIGYGSGTGGRRRAPLTVSLAVLISTALWITIDLDYPRAGLLQLSDEPLRALKFQETPP